MRAIKLIKIIILVKEILCIIYTRISIFYTTMRRRLFWLIIKVNSFFFCKFNILKAISNKIVIFAYNIYIYTEWTNQTFGMLFGNNLKIKTQIINFE